MKTTKSKIGCGGMLAILALAMGLMVCTAELARAAPLGTAFTYQGRLMDVNDTADGLYDFEFKLWMDPCEIVYPPQVGDTLTMNDLDVIDGYFTVELDFGGVFNGSARWLDIGVRPGDSNDANDFVTLSPRTELTPTPYAIYAKTAGGIPGGISGSGTANYIAKFTDPNTLGNSAIYESAGKVGIGTTTPGFRFHQKGGDHVVDDSDISLRRDNKHRWRLVEGPSSGLSIKQVYNDSGALQNNVRMEISDSGNIGIGTTNPRTDLEIQGTTGLRVTTGQHPNVYGDFKHAYSGGLIINANAGGGGWADMSLQTNGTTRMFIESGGKVGIGTTGNPPERLTVRGNILVQSVSTGASVAEIGEGLDYAEGFDVTEDADIEAGTVLVIDSDNPGKLTVSRSAYDSKVAGIVAGAKGIGSGVRLCADQFDYDVALAGRVYCNVDATEAAVRPGDLLTTSATRGYAMKAADYARAQGAILGKAMQKLEKGQKGQILVLVTLQ